jgi:NitT/TauT family transport system substrate-binding protein
MLALRSSTEDIVAKISIMFSRFSAFYSPLIATSAAGFLQAEGLEPEFSVAGPGRSARAALVAGDVQLIQSAVSASWAPLERGESSDLVHFAQINQRDGFFIAARRADADFRWAKLAGSEVLVDHGGQPLAMFRFALHKQAVDFSTLQAIDAGGPAKMIAAFRAGQGDYVHLQGPAPQQLEADGVGAVVASVGEAIGPVAFSSLCATRDWLATDMARAFMRAYAKARSWVVETPAAAIAKQEAAFFRSVGEDVLARTIDAYQRLGTWTPPLEIPRDAYEVALDVFQHAGLITKRHAYEAVIVAPPVL